MDPALAGSYPDYDFCYSRWRPKETQLLKFSSLTKLLLNQVDDFQLPFILSPLQLQRLPLKLEQVSNYVLYQYDG